MDQIASLIARGLISPGASSNLVQRVTDLKNRMPLESGGGAPTNSVYIPRGYGQSIESKAPEKIKSAASRFRGKVYEGPAHMVIDDEVPDKLGVDPFEFMKEREEGFTTSTGRFVSREEAAKIANSTSGMRFESSRVK